MHKTAAIIILSIIASTTLLAQDPTNQMVDGKRHGFWRTEWKNGNVGEGNYNHGKQEGVWKTFDKNGNLISTITYENGHPHGEAVFYFTDGKVREQGFWNVDHWEGEYIRNHENGKPARRASYDDQGRAEGRQFYYHENGKLLYDGVWKAGKITGVLAVYNEQGKKVMERNYDDNGKFQNTATGSAMLPPKKAEEFKGTGNYTLFNEDGTTDKKGYFEEGKLIDGTRYVYNADGSLLRTETVRNGVTTK